MLHILTKPAKHVKTLALPEWLPENAGSYQEYF
jgi:hypothetical protein